MKKNVTFLVQVFNQKNATWQGSVTWMEKNETEHFRSLLELIKLVDAAVETEEEK